MEQDRSCERKETERGSETERKEELEDYFEDYSFSEYEGESNSDQTRVSACLPGNQIGIPIFFWFWPWHNKM